MHKLVYKLIDIFIGEGMSFGRLEMFKNIVCNIYLVKYILR